MIKIIVILIIFVLASALLGGGLGILFDSIGLGAGVLFSPIGIIIEFFNEVFKGMFTSYYILILLGIFLFIILFFFTLNFFVDVFKNRISENEYVEHRYRINKKYNSYRTKKEKQERLKNLDKKFGYDRVQETIKKIKRK